MSVMKFSPDAPDAIKQVNDLLSYITKAGDIISLSPDQILANYRIIDNLEKTNQSTIFSDNSAMDDLYAVAYASGASKYLMSQGVLQKTDQGYSFHVENPDVFNKLLEKMPISSGDKPNSQPLPPNGYKPNPDPKPLPPNGYKPSPDPKPLPPNGYKPNPDPQPQPQSNTMWYVIGGIILVLVLAIGVYEYKKTSNGSTPVAISYKLKNRY